MFSSSFQTTLIYKNFFRYIFQYATINQLNIYTGSNMYVLLIMLTCYHALEELFVAKKRITCVFKKSFIFWEMTLSINFFWASIVLTKQYISANVILCAGFLQPQKTNIRNYKLYCWISTGVTKIGLCKNLIKKYLKQYIHIYFFLSGSVASCWEALLWATHCRFLATKYKFYCVF